ncbi:MAG: purine permease, partial [Bacilli bacterium]|nr:purine permease [Bacilli bacterium]
MGREGAKKTAMEENLYQFDGMIPVSKGIACGLQHIMAMFFSNITPFLVVAAGIASSRAVDSAVINNSIRAASLIAGLGTIIQLLPIWRFGSKLPIMAGTSFTFTGVLILIGAMFGLPTMFISLLIGAGVATLLGLFAKYWVRFIPPIVSGLVVLGVGLSLLPVGVQQLFVTNAGISGLYVDGVYQFGVAWPYLLVGFLTLISGILFRFLFKGKFKNSSILLSIAVGYIVSLCFIPYNNMVDFSVFSFNGVTDIIDVPRPIFTLISFSAGDVNVGAIIAVTIIFLVGMVET